MLKCDICGNELVMNENGQSARCKLCGMNYGIERLSQMVRGAVPSASAVGSADFDIRGGILYSYNGNAEVVHIPDYVVEIAEYAFRDNRRLKSVVFPKCLKKIGRQAFLSCTALQTVHLPDSIEVIEDWAFSGTAIQVLEIPAAVRFGSAFSDCKELKRVTFCNGRTNMWGGFSGCTSLTEVILPSTLKILGSFARCTSLKHIALPQGLEIFSGDAFDGCGALKSITIPYGVRQIEDRAFRRCSALESITIPASVEKLGEGVFVGCSSLTQVTMPNNLIRDDVFLRRVEMDRGPDQYDTNRASPWYIDWKRRAAERAAAERVRRWKEQERCAFCGGKFIGLLPKRCKDCRKPKNY